MEGFFPNAGDAIRNRDASQAAAVNECLRPDTGDAITNRDARKASASSEGAFLDAGDAITNRDGRHVSAITEGLDPDASDTIRDRDAGQVSAIMEGLDPDASDTIGDRDVGQGSAAIEGPLADVGDAVWDDVIGTCLGCRIGMQERHLLIEQNPIDRRVIHVLRANLNHRQGRGIGEGSRANAGNAVRDRDACEAGAEPEGFCPNGDDAIANCDAR